MMHDNDNYYFWGMHAGWWIFALAAIVIIGWAIWSRKRK